MGSGKAMLLFFVGVVEMLIVAIWTKWVVETRIVGSGIVTMINIFIWYYVLQSIVNDIHNFYIVFLYALGCAIGTMLSGIISNYFGNKEKQALSNTENSSLVIE